MFVWCALQYYTNHPGSLLCCPGRIAVKAQAVILDASALQSCSQFLLHWSLPSGAAWWPFCTAVRWAQDAGVLQVFSASYRFWERATSVLGILQVLRTCYKCSRHPTSSENVLQVFSASYKFWERATSVLGILQVPRTCYKCSRHPTSSENVLQVFSASYKFWERATSVLGVLQVLRTCYKCSRHPTSSENVLQLFSASYKF